ncbi:GNAT family N-acetyltransferase [Paenibacillus rigui]|uniref:GNAT family N-acetyltransferase n=1 Tax=Paenibacillus rigui TaxID=554312 RepID=A0A229UGG6_9BACL|nr:GNAT family N-acetyltransferase [Paenibacillus rigui]OXM82451.1 GNAT family N-acetyltransferase [Paenibacillus rigui]
MRDFEIIEIKDGLNTEPVNELLTESMMEGFRHISRLVEDYRNGTNRFDHNDEALFLCLLDNRVIGICGLNRDPYYGDGVGRVRRLYVLKEYRRHNIGRKLTEAVIQKARNYYKRLVLKTDNPNASKFYKTLGFNEVSGDEKMTHYLELTKEPYA